MQVGQISSFGQDVDGAFLYGEGAKPLFFCLGYGNPGFMLVYDVTNRVTQQMDSTTEVQPVHFNITYTPPSVSITG